MDYNIECGVCPAGYPSARRVRNARKSLCSSDAPECSGGVYTEISSRFQLSRFRTLECIRFQFYPIMIERGRRVWSQTDPGRVSLHGQTCAHARRRSSSSFAVPPAPTLRQIRRAVRALPRVPAGRGSISTRNPRAPHGQARPRVRRVRRAKTARRVPAHHPAPAAHPRAAPRHLSALTTPRARITCRPAPAARTVPKHPCILTTCRAANRTHSGILICRTHPLWPHAHARKQGAGGQRIPADGAGGAACPPACSSCSRRRLS